MKLQTMIEQGYILNSWAVQKDRNELRVVLKLTKKTTGGEKFYIAHSPFTGVNLTSREFTEPVLILK